MHTERPSPFTIPEPQFKFVSGPPAEPAPRRTLTVSHLIYNLTAIADSYETATAEMDRTPGFEKRYVYSGREANAHAMQQAFRATEGIDRVRGYVLSTYGDELTLTSGRRFLGDIVRVCGLAVEKAESFLLDEAMSLLQKHNKNADANPAG